MTALFSTAVVINNRIEVVSQVQIERLQTAFTQLGLTLVGGAASSICWPKPRQDCKAAPTFPRHSQSPIRPAQSRLSLDGSPCRFNQPTVCHNRFFRCHQSRISLAFGYCLWASWLIHLAPSARMINWLWSVTPIRQTQENSFRLNSETERSGQHSAYLARHFVLD